jgi:hypothetical protein
MSAIRKLAMEATDNGLLAPELAAGIARVKSAKSIGIRAGNWLSLKQAQGNTSRSKPLSVPVMEAAYFDVNSFMRSSSYQGVFGQLTMIRSRGTLHFGCGHRPR